MTIKLVPRATSLTIGDDYPKKNTIEFTIQLSGDPKFKLLVLEIPVGDEGILRRPEDANNIEFFINNVPTKLTRTSLSPTLMWVIAKSRDGITADTLTVKIQNILCNANSGSSGLTIIGKTGDNDPNPVKEPLTIEKKKPEKPETPILYFIAEPTYLIGGGEVKLTWDVVGDQNATLDTQQQTGKKVTSPTTDRLTDTWTYTLKVGDKQRQVTVNVLKKGWHPIQPLGNNAFPSVIFDPGGRTVDALYTIFVRGTERKAVLCKSTDGITGWQIVNDAVPDGMESSPGVRLGNRLWLIGGSTVDWDQKSKGSCYYDLDHADQGWQDATVTGADGFEERMGHACVIVDDNTIWVMGGLGKYQCLNDVWKLAIDKTDRNKLHATRLMTSSSAWKPRCMFSAVNFNDEIWVCGGVTSPNGNPLGDLWASPSSPMSWKERPTSTSGSVVDAIGTGAAFCGDTLFTVLTNRTGGPSWKFKKEMWTLQKSEITSTSDAWSDSSAPELPAGWTSKPHSIAVVGFKNRLYLRCLHRNAMYGEVVGAPLFVYVGAT
ncbi:MAG: kelch repeat-containing protein [Nitrospira sp.]|nr:kelch repeat-containing protein [Nitrospira sp.]